MPKNKPITKIRKQIYLTPENIKKGEAYVLQVKWNGAKNYNFSRLINDYLTNL